MSIFSLRELLRLAIGRGKKEKSPFASEQDAYEFCLKAYKETGGITPELKKAFEFYRKNTNEDQC